MTYEGIIVEESLENPDVLEGLKITKTEISEDSEWHMHHVVVTEDEFLVLMSSIKEGKWYMNFWSGDEGVVLFRDRQFEFNYGDPKTWQSAVEYGRTLGIPEPQLDFWKESEERQKCLCDNPDCAKCLAVNCKVQNCPVHTNEKKAAWLSRRFQ